MVYNEEICKYLTAVVKEATCHHERRGKVTAQYIEQSRRAYVTVNNLHVFSWSTFEAVETMLGKLANSKNWPTITIKDFTSISGPDSNLRIIFQLH